MVAAVVLNAAHRFLTAATLGRIDAGPGYLDEPPVSQE
jgi:hypothetical protein